MVPRALRRFPFLVGVTAVAIATATTMHSLAVYLPTLNTPHTALEGVPHAPSPIAVSPPLARRVAVLVLDGLSFDAARALPELEPLRRRGVLRSLAVDFPSLTSPAITSFMTGLGPRDSGTRLNGHLHGVVGLDSITRAAAAVRVPVSVFEHGYGDFARIVQPAESARMYPGYFAPIIDLARQRLGEPPARSIDLVHWGLIDEMGHAHGARSREYIEASHDGAAFAARYAASLDLDRDAIFVLSDHGHLDTGGHGGAEPEVRHALFLAAGAPFQRGVDLGERRSRDVASTIAVVAGLRAPTSNLGLPMTDALALPAPDVAAALAAPFDQAARFSCRLAPSPRCTEASAIAARLASRDPTAIADATDLHTSLSQTLDDLMDARRTNGARTRLAITATTIALALWALLVVHRRRRSASPHSAASAGEHDARKSALLPVVNLAVYLAWFGGLGYRPGFTFLRAAPLLILDALPGAILALVASTVLAWRLRPGPAGAWVLMFGTAIPFALLAAWVGWDPTTPPPSIAGAAVFQLAPAVISAAYGAVLVAWLDRTRRVDVA